MLLANRLHKHFDPWRLMNELETQWGGPLTQWLGSAVSAVQDRSVRYWSTEGARSSSSTCLAMVPMTSTSPSTKGF